MPDPIVPIPPIVPSPIVPPVEPIAPIVEPVVPIVTPVVPVIQPVEPIIPPVAPIVPEEPPIVEVPMYTAEQVAEIVKTDRAVFKDEILAEMKTYFTANPVIPQVVEPNVPTPPVVTGLKPKENYFG